MGKLNMGRFNDFDALVSDMIQEFGFIATYQHITVVPNDATGGVSTTTVNIPINCIRQELNRPLNGQGTKGGTMIQDGDVMLYVQPVEKADSTLQSLVVDQTADRIVIGNDTWNIVTVKLLTTDPTDIVAYEMYIRK